MNTNTMELNLNEMEMANGGGSLGEKLKTIGGMAGAGALGGAITGGIAGSAVPGLGNLLLAGGAAVVGGMIGTGVGVVKVFFFDD